MKRWLNALNGRVWIGRMQAPADKTHWLVPPRGRAAPLQPDTPHQLLRPPTPSLGVHGVGGGYAVDAQVVVRGADEERPRVLAPRHGRHALRRHRRRQAAAPAPAAPLSMSTKAALAAGSARLPWSVRSSSAPYAVAAWSARPARCMQDRLGRHTQSPILSVFAEGKAQGCLVPSASAPADRRRCRPARARAFFGRSANCASVAQSCLTPATVTSAPPAARKRPLRSKATAAPAAPAARSSVRKFFSLRRSCAPRGGGRFRVSEG